MTRPRTKRIDGYQIQPLLPMHFPYLGGMVEEADFTTYPDTGTCVEVLMRIGLIKSPYTLVLSIAQALEADIIEKVERDDHDARPGTREVFNRAGRRVRVTIPD